LELLYPETKTYRKLYKTYYVTVTEKNLDEEQLSILNRPMRKDGQARPKGEYVWNTELLKDVTLESVEDIRKTWFVRASFEIPASDNGEHKCIGIYVKYKVNSVEASTFYNRLSETSCDVLSGTFCKEFEPSKGKKLEDLSVNLADPSLQYLGLVLKFSSTDFDFSLAPKVTVTEVMPGSCS